MLNHSFDFDPTYGHTLAELLAITPPPEPEGFAAFWQDAYVHTLGVAPRPTLQPIACEDAKCAAFRVSFDSYHGDRIEGWLLRPADGMVDRALVVGHGYGGRAAPDWGYTPPRTAVLFPCTRGMGLSEHVGMDQPGRAHVLQGIDHRDTYIQRGCVADHWAAGSALLELFPDAKDHLVFHGGSYSGGLGAIAVAFDLRFKRAALSVPSYAHHPLRLTMPCHGSGELVRHYVAKHPEVRDVLRYYDAAIAATYITQPTLIGLARFDPAVPPPGQASVFNAIPENAGGKALFVRTAGHFGYPEEEAENHTWHWMCRSWLGLL